MSFIRRRKKRVKPVREVEPTTVKTPKKRKVTPVEVKRLAMDALKAGIPSVEVCELIGVSNSALGKWRKLYQDGVAKADMFIVSENGTVCDEKISYRLT
jgi:transposase-like protein